MCAIAAGKQQALRSAQNVNVYLVPARADLAFHQQLK